MDLPIQGIRLVGGVRIGSGRVEIRINNVFLVFLFLTNVTAALSLLLS